MIVPSSAFPNSYFVSTRISPFSNATSCKKEKQKEHKKVSKNTIVMELNKEVFPPFFLLPDVQTAFSANLH
jgi:hypothetical protein